MTENGRGITANTKLSIALVVTLAGAAWVVLSEIQKANQEVLPFLSRMEERVDGMARDLSLLRQGQGEIRSTQLSRPDRTGIQSMIDVSRGPIEARVDILSERVSAFAARLDTIVERIAALERKVEAREK